MNKFLGMALLLISFNQAVSASEIQMIEGEEAYQLYETLPGVACQEYRLGNYVVFTKYQTNKCTEEQTDASKWNCTTQFELKNGKKVKVISSSCSREI